MFKAQYQNLRQMVTFLLQRGKEGEYWDFKQEWHDNMPELIKDVICFSNTVHDMSCYLIFGVDDNCNVVGMAKPRRKQADIIDAISNLVFAGDVYPKISLETICINNTAIDVLIIYNVEFTPIYLKRSYGQMREGCIYTRIGDKNTPDKSNADISDIEMLWKKRLGLTKTPLEYIYDRLENQLEWKRQNNTFYNMYRPQYTLVEIDDEDDQCYNEFYSYAMCNESTLYSVLQIKCHETILEEYQLVSLDGGRYTTPVPNWGFLCEGTYDLQPEYSYKYFIHDSNCYRINCFFYDTENDEQRSARRRLFEVVLIYYSDEERVAFESFIEDNQQLFIEAIAATDRYSYVHAENERETEICVKRLRAGIALNKLLKDFRS